MMPRLFLKFALPLVSLFLAVIVFMRVQPVDLSDLRGLLVPPDCPAPCFMGIRPGVTTMDESLALLQGNGWVGQIKQSELVPGEPIIEWCWNEAHPVVFATAEGCLKRIFPSDWPKLRGVGGVVSSIEVPLNVHLSDAWLAMGKDKPTNNFIEFLPNSRMMYQVHYARQQFFFTSESSCPISFMQLLAAPVAIVYAAGPVPGTGHNYTLLDILNQWNHICHKGR